MSHASLYRVLHVLTFAVLLFASIPASAEDVTVEHLGIELRGNLLKAAEKPLTDTGVVLIVHGTLAHHGMEIIAALQKGLQAQGVASLAITLSLGIHARRGMFDCALEHDHRQSDAVDEIAAWVAFVKGLGASRIALAGHSRGAAQVAAYGLSAPDPAVDRLLLLAPLADTDNEVAANYKTLHGGELAALLQAARKLVESGEDDSALAAPGFLYCKSVRVTAAAFLDYYGEAPATAVIGRLRDLKLPVLVVAAGADALAPDVAARITSVVPGNHVQVVVIDGANHFFRDLFGDELVEHVQAFWMQPATVGR